MSNMSNMDTLVSSYLSSGNAKYSQAEIIAAINNLNSATTGHHASEDNIFNFGSNFSNMSEDQFLDMMRTATSSNGNLDSDIAILYEIMNTDGEAGLSGNEIDALFGSGTSSSGISIFDVWKKTFVSSDNITITTTVNGSDDDDDDTPVGGDSDGDDTPVGGDDDGDGDGDGTSTPTYTGKPSDFSNVNNWNSVISYINGFVVSGSSSLDTPEKVIQYLLDNNHLTEEEAKYARNAFIYDSQEDSVKQSIAQYLGIGTDFDEIISLLGIDKNDTTLTETPYENKSKLKAGEAKGIADDLKDSISGVNLFGYGHGAFTAILDRSDLNADDWVEIIAAYDGNFIGDVNGESWWGSQKEIEETIAKKLLEAAKNGNDKAIEVLCKQIHNGTAEILGTANEFVDYILEHADKEVLAKIKVMYPDVNNNDTLIGDIKGDYSWLTGESAKVSALTSLDTTDAYAWYESYKKSH